MTVNRKQKQIARKRAELSGLSYTEALRYVRSAGEPFRHPTLGLMPGYVAGECGHRVAESEWRVGFRECERCPKVVAE